MSVFNRNAPTTTDRAMFLDIDGPVGIQRYDVSRYPIFMKLTKQQIGNFWRPEEVDCSRDAKDFRQLTEHEQFIFTRNLMRQILLDTIQGRAPSQVLGPICSLPEVEAFINAWTFIEQIHSMSYTHIIQGVYPNPSKMLDEITQDPLIMSLADNISGYYDRLNSLNHARQANRYLHKKALWLCLNAINALEGIRFYVSFACSWAFAEVKKMEGNAKIIKLICKDENIHLAATQNMLKLLVRDDPDFAKIKVDTEQQVIDLFTEVVNQEKQWAEYLFKDGSMIGLNYDLLSDYVEWIANKRMQAINVASPFKGGSNPLPWTQKWISDSDVQDAPQETEITKYSQTVRRTKDQSKLNGITL